MTLRKWLVILLALLAGLLPGVLAGCSTGLVFALIGGNYAQHFMFLGVRGYEAMGLLGVILGAIFGAIGGGILSSSLVRRFWPT